MTESKPVVWLKGEVKTPPFGEGARLEAGFLLRKKSRATPKKVVRACQARLEMYRSL